MSAFSYQQAKAIAQELKAKGLLPKVDAGRVKQSDEERRVQTRECMRRLRAKQKEAAKQADDEYELRHRAEHRIAMQAVDPFYPRKGKNRRPNSETFL